MKTPASDHQNEKIEETTDEVAADTTTEIGIEGDEDQGPDPDREIEIVTPGVGETAADPGPDLETDLDETDTK